MNVTRTQFFLSLGAVAVCAAASAGCTTSSPIDRDGGPGVDAPVIIDFDVRPIDTGPPDTGVVCEPGLVDCDGTCTRLAADSLNCGSCGNACPAGTTCAIGRCDCMEPRLACDGLCIDPSSDPMNCGECGEVCDSTQMCSMGECIVMCTEADHRVCVNRDAAGEPVQVCSNAMTDPLNCGACNTRCAAGSSCVMGRCVCPGLLTSCASGCTDTSTDPDNCGGCLISCGEGGTCAAGRCTTCGSGLTACGTAGRCFDTMTSRLHCGSCGRACGGGEACVGGLCECTGSLVDCGSGCRDLTTDEENCGACGVDCGPGGLCTGSTCTCAAGLTMCGPECADTMRDEDHCGDCDTTCDPGYACQMGTCVLADSFRVTGFLATGCLTMEHGTPSGDDRGGVAVSASQLFVTGDTSTVRLSASDLTGLAAVGTVHNGILSDVESEEVYVLLTAAGVQPNGSAVVTQLGRLDPMTGVLTATRIPLSAPISVTSGSAIMSGYGEALIGVLAGSVLQWWHIALPDGDVTRLGDTASPTHRTCENWAWWGIAEVVDDVHYAVYVASTTAINRVQIPTTGMGTAAPTLVSSFTNLGDMCSIGFSTSRNRWYFHHEYESQFSPTTTLGEIAGTCNATWDRP